MQGLSVTLLYSIFISCQYGRVVGGKQLVLPWLFQKCSIEFMLRDNLAQIIRTVPSSKRKSWIKLAQCGQELSPIKIKLSYVCSIKDCNKSDNLIPVSLISKGSIPNDFWDRWAHQWWYQHRPSLLHRKNWHYPALTQYFFYCHVPSRKCAYFQNEQKVETPKHETRQRKEHCVIRFSSSSDVLLPTPY